MLYEPEPCLELVREDYDHARSKIEHIRWSPQSSILGHLFPRLDYKVSLSSSCTLDSCTRPYLSSPPNFERFLFPQCTSIHSPRISDGVLTSVNFPI